ncbi:MAG: (2Fe-2S)-binding protein [Planctomycetes bacterium]|nr:(2Fe-2S)-binding protein [Planctomycetota bacterium]
MSETTTERLEVPFTIDGASYTALKGETVLEAALRNGYFIPHYCWHPSLSIAGNCRMCLVHTKPGPPKPQIACNTVVSEGMEVDASSEKTLTAREGILEFLLANHPLDCPICDQAGECDLQQYSFDHGRTTSKFSEIKTQRPRHDLGPRIRFNGNRCILCTRCVRFCDEVTGTGELTVVNRSDSAWIDVFPGVPLDNPLSGCTADLCPVGALLDSDWIHTTRVWLLRGTKSVCSGCATGCNVNVEAFDDSVKRMTPRENQPVNKWWMCDEGRDSHREATTDSRLNVARLDGQPVKHQDALEAALDLFSATPAAKIAYLTTGHATCEELHLLETITDGPGGVNYRPDGGAFETLDGFKLSADKNPNRAGVVAVLGDVDAGERVRKGIESGQIELVVVCDSQPGGANWDEGLVEALKGDVKAIVISLEDTWLAQTKQVAFPGLHAIEKDGTFVNQNGRLQRVRAAVSAPGDTRGELDVLQELGRSAGHFPRVLSAGGVFRRLAAASPDAFGGLTYRGLGAVGLPLAGAADQTPADKCQTYYNAGPVSRETRAQDEQTRVAVHRESPLGYGTVRGNV